MRSVLEKTAGAVNVFALAESSNKADDITTMALINGYVLLQKGERVLTRIWPRSGTGLAQEET